MADRNDAERTQDATGSGGAGRSARRTPSTAWILAFTATGAAVGALAGALRGRHARTRTDVTDESANDAERSAPDTVDADDADRERADAPDAVAAVDADDADREGADAREPSSASPDVEAEAPEEEEALPDGDGEPAHASDARGEDEEDLEDDRDSPRAETSDEGRPEDAVGAERPSEGVDSGGEAVEKAHERPPTSDGGPRGRVLARVKEEVAEITGHDVEAVAGMRPDDGNWRLTLEVLELERIPRSTDVLGLYEVVVDDDGQLVEWNRVRRYYRNQAEEQEGE